jgi:hypothetical protein
VHCGRILAIVLLAGAASAQLRDEVPLGDLLEVLVIDRQVLAVDARGGGQLALPLRLDEEVLWKGSRGRIGVVLTDQRVLAAAVGSAAWQQEGLHRGEVWPAEVLLGDRVALLATSRRLIGFDGGSGNLVESSLGLREQLWALRTGDNVAVAVTDRRALGLSPTAGGFFPIAIQEEEKLESVEANANLATVTTNRRLLIFRTPTGTWEVRHRTLN